MRVTRVLHASVNTSAAAGPAEAFYAEVLGLTSTARPAIPGIDGAWFDVAGTELHLVDAPEGGDGPDPVAHHVCLAVDDLDGALAELDRRGITVVRGAQGEVAQAWIRDPAGNTIELQQERDPGRLTPP